MNNLSLAQQKLLLESALTNLRFAIRAIEGAETSAGGFEPDIKAFVANARSNLNQLAPIELPPNLPRLPKVIDCNCGVARSSSARNAGTKSPVISEFSTKSSGNPRSLRTGRDSDRA